MTTKKIIEVSAEGFKSHMERKCEIWGPEFCHLGADFAVMEFGTTYALANAWKDLESYNEYYEYSICEDQENKQLSIVNSQES
jgi:hypothetical protein